MKLNWIRNKVGEFMCPSCGKHSAEKLGVPFLSTYCPHCGIKLEGDANE